ncbi:MAG: hypothetical protein L6Q72_10440, partial [Burkholderiaceae bacterium]|nr:hypothetical protein [Burkholderiaceae bacterium]
MAHTDAKRGWMSRTLPGSLAAVIVLAGCTGDDTQKNEPSQPAGANSCATAPALFTDKVWPSLEQACVACHASGRVAAGTKLVFATGAGTEVQNYNILRDFVANTGDLVLTKSIGLPTHGGGKPFVDTNSQQYKDLAALLPTLRQSCAPPATPVPPAQAQFWQGVTFADDATTLARAAVLFAGRNPTAAELAAVSSGGANALRQTIRGYMQGPAFERFLFDVGDTHFLSPGVIVFGNHVGYNAADFPLAADLINNVNLPAGVRNRFAASARREGIELMRYIVRNDR